jgi:hypothetical protein
MRPFRPDLPGCLRRTATASHRVMVQRAIVVVRRRFDRVQFEPGQFRRHGIFRDVKSGWPKKKTLCLILRVF